MIKVTVGTNTNRKVVITDENRTLKSVLDEYEINYSTANVHLDGATVSAGELNKSFKDLGVTESCYLIAVVKADNA